MKQRVSAARAAAAPWRAIMRDQNDDMIFSMRGLPEQVRIPAACCCPHWPACLLPSRCHVAAPVQGVPAW